MSRLTVNYNIENIDDYKKPSRVLRETFSKDQLFKKKNDKQMERRRYIYLLSIFILIFNLFFIF